MPIFVAPYSATYASHSPYLTNAEYALAPTGVDISALVPMGGTAANSAALTRVIAQASSTVDQICRQTLAATSNTESGTYRVRRDGTIRVITKFWPILEVDSFQVGYRPSQLVDISDTADMWVRGRTVLEVPVVSMNMGPSRWTGFRAGEQIKAVWTYINGWAVSLITEQIMTGAQAIELSTVLGMYPGTVLTIFDGAFTEDVIIESVAGSTINLVAPTLYAHIAGARITNLPPAVEEAAICLTSWLIKQRGAEAIALDSIGSTASPSKVLASEAGGMEDFSAAEYLLHDFRAVTPNV